MTIPCCKKIYFLLCDLFYSLSCSCLNFLILSKFIIIKNKELKFIYYYMVKFKLLNLYEIQNIHIYNFMCTF